MQDAPCIARFTGHKFLMQCFGLFLIHPFECGNFSQAHDILAELGDRATTSYVRPYTFALVYLGLGDTEVALDWFDKAVSEHDVVVIWTPYYFPFQVLANNPRYQQILKKITLASG